jgi:hypothetical protein
MFKRLLLIAATGFGLAAFVQPAVAQDMNTVTFNGTTLWIGGGVQFLSLPDIKFTSVRGSNGFHRQKNSEGDWSDFGGAVGGGFETALGFWGDTRVTGGIKGFWSNVQTDNTTKCGSVCKVVDPATGLTGFGPNLHTSTDRDADYWGTQAELKFGRAEPVMTKPDLYRNDYFIVGFDVRGIDQDNKLRGRAPDFFTYTAGSTYGSGNGITVGGPTFGTLPGAKADTTVFNYKEGLNTTYVGGYIGIGGEYSFGFIPGVKSVGGLYDRLGLRTFVSLRGGLYDAETDYDGRFLPTNSKISMSNDDLAFIGTVSLETRKQIGARTSLSLWTDYEYISSVPQMRYDNGTGKPTRIDSDDVFASRTMLRLNIGFGPSQLYDEPLK